MKKIISVLLVIALMATLFVGCSNNEKPDPTTPNNPTTNQNGTNDQTTPTNPDEDFVEKFENISTKYNVFATYNYASGDIEKMEDAFEDAMSNKDFEALNDIVGNLGQTVIMLPNNDKYTYEQEYDGYTIVDEENQKMIELHLVPYMNELEEIEEQGASKFEKLEYSSHSGQAYKWTYEDETMYVYVGVTKCNMTVGTISNDFDSMKELLGELIVVESKSSDAVTMDDVNAKDGLTAYIEEYQLIFNCNNLDGYEYATDEYGIYLKNKKADGIIEIWLDDPEYIADEITDYMQEDENIKNIKYVDTKNVFGFAIQLDDEVCFYGFDKDSYGALIAEGECSMENLFTIVKEIDIHKCAFSKDTLVQIEESLTAKDESAVGELASAIMLAMSDQDVYEELLFYVCDGNVSSYISESANLEDAKMHYDCNHKIEHYYYNESARLKDGMYSVAGNMHGVTITFYPIEKDGKYYYMIGDGIINDFVKPANTVQGREDIEVIYDGDIPDYEKYGTLRTMQNPESPNHYLYNRIRAILGDSIEISSSAYRDVPLTIFITMDSSVDFASRVYKQFGGFIQE